MHLTLSTDYALRVLIYLGVKGDRLSTIAEIALRFDVTRTHLMKVVNKLVRDGHVTALRGRSGGIRLARAPDEISIGSLVRETEEELAVIGCLAETGFCRIEGCCVLRRALREATLAFLGTLDRYSLADLLAPQESLARSLGLESAISGPE